MGLQGFCKKLIMIELPKYITHPDLGFIEVISAGHFPDTFMCRIGKNDFLSEMSYKELTKGVTDETGISKRDNN
jgi:hypothetical protein